MTTLPASAGGGTPPNFAGVCFGNGVVCVVGAANANNLGSVYFTQDLTTWTDRSGGKDGNNVTYSSVAYGKLNNVDTWEIVSSTDNTKGLAAQPAAAIPTLNELLTVNHLHVANQIAYIGRGIGMFAAAGNGGWTEWILTADATLWSNAFQPAGTTNDLKSIDWGAPGAVDTLVTTDTTGQTYVDNTQFPATSNGDFIASQAKFTSAGTPNYNLILQEVKFLNGRFNAVGDGAAVLTSAAGTGSFSVIHFVPNTTLNGSFAGTVNNAPLYVAVGDPDNQQNSALIYTSTDATTWTRRLPTTLTNQVLKSVTQGGAAGSLLFVAVGGNALATSTDGVTWTGSTTALTQSYNGVTFGGGKFVAVGDTGWFQTSTDGLTWTPAAQVGNGNPDLKAVAYGRIGGVPTDTYVAVGNGGEILKSTNGTAWSLVTTLTNLKGITFTGSKFVAVGQNGLIATSTDATVWTTANISAANLFGITFISTPNAGSTRDIFVAVGFLGFSSAIYTSSDGTTWTQITPTPAAGTLVSAFASSVLTSVLNPITNVTTNTYNVVLGVVGTSSQILNSR